MSKDAPKTKRGRDYFLEMNNFFYGNIDNMDEENADRNNLSKFASSLDDVLNNNNFSDSKQVKSGNALLGKQCWQVPPWSRDDEKQLLIPRSWRDNPLEKFCLLCGNFLTETCILNSNRECIKCVNIFCKDQRPHSTEFCPTLHHRCARCRLRGHFEDQCQGTLQAARRVFLPYADQGSLTCKRLHEMGYGLLPVFVEKWPRDVSKEQWHYLETKASPYETVTTLSSIGYDEESKIKEAFRLAYIRRQYCLEVVEESEASKRLVGPVVYHVDPFEENDNSASGRAYLSLRRYAVSKNIRMVNGDFRNETLGRAFRRMRQFAFIAEVEMGLDLNQLQYSKFYMKKDEIWTMASEEETRDSVLPTVYRDDFTGRLRCLQAGRGPVSLGKDRLESTWQAQQNAWKNTTIKAYEAGKPIESSQSTVSKTDSVA